jgi:hypothetical protein
MPIAPCFDPATGASGGAKSSGGGMPPWETLVDVNFRSQGTQSLGSATSFSVVDASGRTITGSTTASFVNQPGVTMGIDPTKGYFVDMASSTTNTTGQIAMPLAFKSGVVLGVDDDVRVTVTGLIFLPGVGHRQYWMAGMGLPPTYGYEAEGKIGTSMLRFNSTQSYLRFDFNGGQSVNYTPTAPVSPGTTLQMIDGTTQVEMGTFWPRRATRGETYFSQPNISRILRSWGGQDARSPQTSIQALSSPYSVPSPWNGKTNFLLVNTSYNASVAGGSPQSSQIYSVKLERRSLA